MKIGILTFHDSNDNYGQLLQCFAVETFLKEHGHEPFLIEYNRFNDMKTKNIIKLLVKKIIHKDNKISDYTSIDRGFNAFRKKYIQSYRIKYDSYHDLKKNPPKLDMIIVGSDQVWNFYGKKRKLNKNIANSFLLNFVHDDTICSSFAASWGMTNINKKDRIFFSKSLSKFKLVTVREDSGVKICDSLGITSKWVVDPTLHFSKEFYINNFRLSKIDTHNKYLFIYYVENGGSFPFEKIKKWAQEKKLLIKFASANNGNNPNINEFPTVDKWLELIYNAEYVITNSFHCCVFSMIFQKKFGVLHINGQNNEMNTRFESLFNVTGISSRYIDNDFSLLDKNLENICIKDANFFNHYFDDLVKNM